MTAHQGNVQVNVDELVRLLLLPPGTRIVRVDDWTRQGTVTFRVEHEDLPPVADGATFPDVHYTASVIKSHWEET